MNYSDRVLSWYCCTCQLLCAVCMQPSFMLHIMKAGGWRGWEFFLLSLVILVFDLVWFWGGFVWESLLLGFGVLWVFGGLVFLVCWFFSWAAHSWPILGHSSEHLGYRDDFFPPLFLSCHSQPWRKQKRKSGKTLTELQKIIQRMINTLWQLRSSSF